MVKTFIHDIVESVKQYYKLSLVIVATTSLIIPIYFHILKMDNIRDDEKYISHLYKHLNEGSNIQTSEVMICEFVGCFAVIKDGEIYTANFGYDMHDVIWASAKYHELKKIESYNEIEIDWYKRFFVHEYNIVNNDGETVLILKKNFWPEFIKDVKAFVFIELIIVLVTLYLFRLLSRKESQLYKEISEKESSLLNNIMTIYITENLHHELLTPVKVIMTKARVLGSIVEKYDIQDDNAIYAMDGKYIEKSKESLDYIEMSIQQITSVLENMRQAKMVKKSDNQTVFDVIEHSINLIDIITATEFRHELDAKLDEFALNQKLSTGAFLNIMLNHIKNSIEADADLIEFKCVDDNDKFVYLHIKDDGNGIPEKVLKHLFETNNSSKVQANKSQSIRGNGLFLNKNIMERSGGDITLIETSSEGTTFEIKIPTNRVSKIDKKP